ncbi:hypothetical protein BSKO_08460 [Bryopsis sp. KO-2023]|nr:hypothetical protein BSKO_08460 [Bryopsis sp. KO-2023]
MSSAIRAALLLALAALSAIQCVNARELLQDAGGEAPGPIGGLVTDLGCVVINEVVHKPEDAGEVKGVDFVELYNTCDAEEDLTGWSITDEKENSFVMGQNGCDHKIGAGERLVLFRKNDCSFEFGYGGVDTATLRDATSSVVDKVSWGKENANKGLSWSRIPDGGPDFQDGKPTAGGPNSA